MKTIDITLILAMSCSLAVSVRALESSGNPAIGELFHAKILLTPPKEQSVEKDILGREWRFADPDRANLTHFSEGISNLQVTAGGALKFNMAQNKASVGWGNTDGRQPVSERIELWDSQFEVQLEACQAHGTASVWKLRALADGQPENLLKGKVSQAALAGTEWQTLRLSRIPGWYSGFTRRPDGLILEIEAAPGTEITIRNLDIIRTVREGYYRKEIDIPTGKIWRAVATVGIMGRLYVNGQEATDNCILGARPQNKYFWQFCQTRSLDVQPYLHAGRNCLGLGGVTPGPDRLSGAEYLSQFYLQGAVIMESGEIIRFDSDADWRWSSRLAQGWAAAGFDDSAWRAIGGDPTNAQAAAVAQQGLGLKNVWDRPADDGCLVLENPVESRLFFAETNALALRVRIPAGFAARAPEVEWTLNRFVGGRLSAVQSGVVKSFVKRDDSLVFEIAQPPLPRGIYAVQAALRAGGALVERRVPEPLLVAGRIPMQAVAGTNIEDGMDLALETTIDFTDPADPHPWVECDTFQEVKTPAIVERQGLKYRETRPNYAGRHCNPSAFFAYNIQFQHPGDFYLLALEYPDDRERWMGVSLATTYDGPRTMGKSTPAVYTGGRYPVSGQMRELKWLHRADAGWTAVNVMTLMKDVPAAASRLKIYHVAGRLPALDVQDAGARRLGGVMESMSYRYAFFPRRNPAGGWDQTTGARADTRPVQEACQALEDYLDTAERYAEYLRFCGQNLAVIGAYQYNDAHPNSLYARYTSGYDGIGAARIPMDIRHTLVRVFRENGLAVLANVQFMDNSMLTDASENVAGNSRVRAGADTFQMVAADGTQSGFLNFLHPRVAETMFRVAEDVADAFQDQPNFLGVYWQSHFGGDWLPSFRLNDYGKSPAAMDPFHFTYDDAAIRRFEADTKIQVPGAADDPERFRKRRAFFMSAAVRPEWERWRCGQIAQFFDTLGARLRARRPDLTCVPTLYFFPDHTRQWLESGESLQSFMRAWGWDPALFRENQLWFPQMLQAKYVLPSGDRRSAWQGWEQNTGRDFYELYRRATKRAVAVHHGTLEIERSYDKLPERANWARPFQSTMHTRAAGDFAREPFTQALVGADPELVLFGYTDAGFLIGDEQPLRAFARVLRALPAERFEAVDGTGLESNLAIRELRKDGDCFVVVANPGYWPVTGRLTLENAGAVRNLASGAAELGPDGVLTVPLAPYGVAAYRLQGAGARIKAWKIDPLSGQELAHMRGIVARIRANLENPNVMTMVAQDDIAFMRETADAVAADLQAGAYARAWARATNWRVWALLEGGMKKAMQLAGKVELVDVSALPVLNAHRTAAPPVLDGTLNDPCWRRIKPAGDFVTRDRIKAQLSTTLRLAYDDENLYLAVDCEDPAPAAVRAAAQPGREMEFWSAGDDLVGLFFQPDPARDLYYHLACTAGGVKFDQQVRQGARDYAYAPPWQTAAAKTAQSWTAEIAIPLASLEAGGGAGQVWKMNCFRIFRNNAQPAAYWSWVGDGGAHDTARFGELRFLP